MSGFQRSFLRTSGALLRRGFASETKAAHPPLTALVRQSQLIGSRPSRKIREGRRVPGVVYGVDNDGNVSKQLVTVHELDIERELRRVGMSFENTIYELVVKRELTEDELKTVKPTETKTTPTEVAAPQEPGVHREGDEYRPKWGYKPKVKKVRVEEPAVELERILVTPRQIQFNPATDKAVSVNFLRYRPGNRVRIPVEYVNEEASQDIRRGSFLVRINNFVECVCGDEVPAKLQIDLSEAKKGDVYRLCNIKLPPQVRPSKHSPLDLVLGVVQSSRG